MDPLGMPLATAVRSGERADEGFDIPVIDRIRAGLSTSGLLFVGDGKMSAVGTRAPSAGHQHFSLAPLPLTGATAEAREAGITEGIGPARDGALGRVVRPNDRGQEVLAAEGDELQRSCCLEAGKAAGTERILVVRSPVQAAQQAAGLEKRLAHAEKKLAALTPGRGRGKRQVADEATLVEAMNHILTEQRVEGLLSLHWEPQTERHPHYVGRGRGSETRAKRVIETIRSHMTRIDRHQDNIATLTARCGWKACVPNATPTRRSVEEAVLCSRNAYRVARLVNRLKSRGHIAPLCVQLNEHIQGLTSLRTLGVRVLTVMECVVRRSLQQDQAALPGLHPENTNKMTDKPTAERLLKASAAVSLPIRKHAAGEEILRRLTPLSEWQEDILQRQGLGTALYGQLEMRNIEN